MSPAEAPKPIAAGERIQEIDIVRGFALLGIFIMNLPEMASSPWAGADGSHAFPMWWDRAAEVARDVLFSGKFNSMFSLLFGVGFTIQLARLEAKLGSRGIVLYVRRLFVLVAFGIAHLIALWIGDVLHLYAVLGVLLLLLRRASDRTILAIIAACVLEPNLYSVYRLFTVTPARVKIDIATAQSLLASSNAAYGHGSVVDAMRENAHEFFVYYTHFTRYAVSFDLQMMATLLLGFIVGRRRIIQEARANLPMLRKAQWIGLGIGVVCGTLYGVIEATDNGPMGPTVLRVVQNLAYTLCRPCIMIFYVTTILRAAQKPAWLARFAPLAAVGRMSLTNYLLQTVMGTFIFHAWGLGFWGSVGQAGTLAIPVVLYVVIQVPFSVLWLRRFEFGPMEWLWRALTYGHMPAMRRAAPAVALG